MKIRLIKANDDLLLSQAVSAATESLLDGADPSLAVEELTEEAYRNDEEQLTMQRLVDAAQTPPFLTERRVVIARHMGRFSKAADVGALVSYLEAPLETTDLLLVWEKGIAPKQDRLPAVPKPLQAALEAAGAEFIDAGIPSGKAAGAWLDRQLAASSVRFDRAAAALIAEHLGEQRSRVVALLSTLEAIYGAGAALTGEQVAPYLGASGDVPPWELTDAIDSGNIADCLLYTSPSPRDRTRSRMPSSA